jgi:hypothetical protein
VKGHVAEPGKGRLLVGYIVCNALHRPQVAQLRVWLGQPVRAVGTPGHHAIALGKPLNAIARGLNPAYGRVAHVAAAILIDIRAEPAALAAGADLRAMDANEHLSRARLGYVELLDLDPISTDLDQSPACFRHL